MTYKLGMYKIYTGGNFNLEELDHDHQKHFLWLMQEYEAATSWKDFQERTAAATVQLCLKHQEKLAKKEIKWNWEEAKIYQIRFDMLRNVGIRTGELKGELSDMIIKQ